jgi:S-DNA-T family DNA segregation ATPase FtsK/SpoIIIE
MWRKETPGPHRTAIILIDGFATLKDELQDFEGQKLLDALYRVYADGPAVGLHFAVSSSRAKGVPSAMDDVTTQRWVYRLADQYDYSNFGVKGKDVPAAVAGRCIDATTMLQMHIATPEIGFEAAVQQIVTQRVESRVKQDVIGSLPDRVPAVDVASAVQLAAEPLLIPVGIREDTLEPACLELYEGEHVFIGGPARSGKSSLLCAIAEVLSSAKADVSLQVWGVYDRRSPLGNAQLDRQASTPEEVPGLLAALKLEPGPIFLLVDDIERVDDSDQGFANLIGEGHSGVTIIAAGRSADVRSLYSHWAKPLRKSRCGVLFQPDHDFDGELLGVSIPRRSPVAMTVGRGYACVAGSLALMQAMSPSAEG